VQTQGRWCLADGEAGPGVDTFLLLANPSTEPRRARVTLFFEDGGEPVSKDFDIAPTSRFNVYPPVDFAASFDAVTRRRFGARVESVSAGGIAAGPVLIVERAMYSGDGVHVWAAGTNALATSCQ
jgi:hypothetical protein